jgi:undecaprenyl diphosphate synthase
VPELPDVNMVLRSSGENRFSNFMLWQSAYAKMVFQLGWNAIAVFPEQKCNRVPNRQG